MRDNMPCREAGAVKLAPDHTSKLDAVLVGPCFIQCFVGEKTREREREEKRKRREEKEREREKEQGQEQE